MAVKYEHVGGDPDRQPLAADFNIAEKARSILPESKQDRLRGIVRRLDDAIKDRDWERVEQAFEALMGALE